MKDWEHYITADEFAADSTFREWVRSGAYRTEGHPFTDFFYSQPHLMPLVVEAIDLLRVTDFPDAEMAPGEIAAHIEATWRKIRRREDSEVQPLGTRRGWLRWVAAAVAVVTVGGLLTIANQPTGLFDTLTSKTPSAPVWQATTNNSPHVSAVALPDGSVVWLEPEGTLHYPEAFENDKREVKLEGEAFFEIAKNADKPFFVKTRDLTTRVVGTSFLVKTLAQDGGTIVQVRTGEVWVYTSETPEETPVALRASQQLRVSATAEAIQTEPGPRQHSAISERLDEQVFEFTETPASTVLSTVAAAYGLSLAYDATKLADCPITTTLTDEPLTEKLQILAETIGPGTKAELIEGKIKVTGPGCL